MKIPESVLVRVAFFIQTLEREAALAAILAGEDAEKSVRDALRSLAAEERQLIRAPIKGTDDTWDAAAGDVVQALQVVNDGNRSKKARKAAVRKLSSTCQRIQLLRSKDERLRRHWPGASLEEQTRNVLTTLTPRGEQILRTRFGIAEESQSSPADDTNEFVCGFGLEDDDE